MNLRMIDTMKNSFHLPVGLSDHTLGISIPLAAVAREACVIEKHLTLNRTLEGPDHSFALEPSEMKQMIRSIREVEQSLGSPVKSFISGVENPKLHKKSIVSKVCLSKGEVITNDMITVKRSPDGIGAKFFDTILGKKVRRNIEEDEVITWEMI